MISSQEYDFISIFVRLDLHDGLLFLAFVIIFNCAFLNSVRYYLFVVVFIYSSKFSWLRVNPKLIICCCCGLLHYGNLVAVLYHALRSL